MPNNFIKQSTYKDRSGDFMVDINGAHYPVEFTKELLLQLDFYLKNLSFTKCPDCGYSKTGGHKI